VEFRSIIIVSSENNNLSDLQRLKYTASHNRKHILYNTYIVTINGRKYALKIMGVGKQKVRFDLFIDYKSILKYKDVGVEKILYDAINKVYDLK